MKESYFFILIFHLVITVQYGKSETYKQWYDEFVRNCTPGTSFRSYKENMVCYCQSPGVIDHCEFVGYKIPGVRLLSRQDLPGSCSRPGEPFFDGCNWCQCKKNGRSGNVLDCTNLRCFQKLKKDKSGNMIGGAKSLIDFNAPGPSKNCPAGRIKHPDGCNWCSCTNGWTICTRMACANKNKLAKNTFPCRDNPHAKFLHEDGCNWCYCLDHYTPLCTVMYCNKKNTLKKTKTEINECQDKTAERFLADDGCNWCYCIGSGAIMCTITECASPVITLPMSLSSSMCKKAGEPYSDGCNTCYCTDSTRAMCTLMLCDNYPYQKGENAVLKRKKITLAGNKKLKSLKELAQNCKTGEKFKEPHGCHMCTCIEDGVVVCDTKPCIFYNILDVPAASLS